LAGRLAAVAAERQHYRQLTSAPSPSNCSVTALPSAVQKSFMPHRSKASLPKMSACVLQNHLLNGQFLARFCALTDTKIAR
jgi:hypothetical protein